MQVTFSPESAKNVLSKECGKHLIHRAQAIFCQKVQVTFCPETRGDFVKTEQIKFCSESPGNIFLESTGILYLSSEQKSHLF
jgi:hypothetical protein